MLALKVRRHLERAWWSLEVTVEEGFRARTLCVMELVHPQSAEVVAREVPEPSARQKREGSARQEQLSVNSKLGEGTRVEVRIPVGRV